ncbi:hypothetical protein Nmel_004585 [Mimus melanotis]
MSVWGGTAPGSICMTVAHQASQPKQSRLIDVTAPLQVAACSRTRSQPRLAMSTGRQRPQLPQLLRPAHLCCLASTAGCYQWYCNSKRKHKYPGTWHTLENGQKNLTATLPHLSPSAPPFRNDKGLQIHIHRYLNDKKCKTTMVEHGDQQEVRRDLIHNTIHIDLQPLERLVAAQIVPHHKVFPTCLPFLHRDQGSIYLLPQRPVLHSPARKTDSTVNFLMHAGNEAAHLQGHLHLSVKTPGSGTYAASRRVRVCRTRGVPPRAGIREHFHYASPRRWLRRGRPQLQPRHSSATSAITCAAPPGTPPPRPAPPPLRASPASAATRTRGGGAGQRRAHLRCRSSGASAGPGSARHCPSSGASAAGPGLPRGRRRRRRRARCEGDTEWQRRAGSSHRPARAASGPAGHGRARTDP